MLVKFKLFLAHKLIDLAEWILKYDFIICADIIDLDAMYIEMKKDYHTIKYPNTRLPDA